MATDLDLQTTWADNADLWDGDTAQRVTRVLESQVAGAYELLGNGVKTGFVVTSDSGLSVSIAAGRGIAASVKGSFIVETSAPVTLSGLDANATNYIFATIETSTNDTRETRVPLFTHSLISSSADGILIASVVTGASSVSSVADLRTILSSTLDINGLTADSAPVDADTLSFYKVSATANRKVTFANAAAYFITKLLSAARTFTGNLFVNGVFGVGTTSNDATAAMQIDSTAKGFLGPRMTTTQRDAITTPATGLLIYNTTTAAFNVFNGSAWAAIGGGLSDVAVYLDGTAAGAQPGLNFVTGDNQTISISEDSGNNRVDVRLDVTGQPSVIAHSVTSLVIGTGSKAFEIAAGIGYVVGSRVRAASAANTANFMEGVVTAYAGTTLTVLIDNIGGSGTRADWNVSLSGDVGQTGATGATGAAAANYGGTSASSVAIGTGNKVFVTQAGMAYQVGARVRVSLATDTAKFVEGRVTAYSGTSLTVSADTIGGSGTYSNWKFNVAGQPGIPAGLVTADVAGRGANLIANGNGDRGNGTNFAALIFDALNPHSSGGSFKLTGAGTNGSTGRSDELIPIDPARVYRLSAWAKTTNLVASNNYGFIGLEPSDVDGNVIAPAHFLRIAGTDTTLASDLNPGDTVVHLTSAANWKNDGASLGYERQISIWDYQNALGYSYPANTYSRHTSQNYAGYDPSNVAGGGGAWAPGGVSGNNLTLRAAWPSALGTIPAGTPVSNGTSGNTYLYAAASNVAIPTSWTHYSGDVTGTNTDGQANSNAFPPGTSFVKALFLANRNVTGAGGTAGNTTNFADITLYPTPVAADISDFTEAVQDAVAAALVAGSGQSITYDDASNTITFVNSAPLTSEAVQDIVAAMTVAGANVTASYDDAAGTLTIASAGGGGGLTTEDVQDIVAALLVQGSNVTLTYNDAANTLTVTAAGGGGASLARATVTVTTASLANLAIDNLAATIGKTAVLLAVEVDRAAWVRVYNAAANRTADATRDINDDPVSDSGCLVDQYITGASKLWLAPTTHVYSGESTPVSGLSCAIQNRSGATHTVQVIFTFLALE